MDEKELKETLKLLEDAGMAPQLCDTLLPHYMGKVNCGVPLETSGDIEEMIPIPKVLPNHPKLPTVRELQRMDVQSFSKPVRLWDRDDAPVDRKRFAEYLDVY